MIQNCIRKSPRWLSLASTGLLALLLLSLAACGGSSSTAVSSMLAAADMAVQEDTVASAVGSALGVERLVMTTNVGEIHLQLDNEKAPDTVANFLNYVDAGHYDQTIFHRVIAGFMIQGGGFSADYQRNVTNPPILNEAANGLANDRYTIAMARTPKAHSATDQFFINLVDNPFLNYRGPADSSWGYAVFGKVTEGFDVVDKIASVTTGAAGPFSTDVPVEPVIILRVERR